MSFFKKNTDNTKTTATKKSNEKPLIFTMLGPSGSGKTSMLACMNRTFENVLAGTFYPDRRTLGVLDDAYEILKSEADSSKIQFDVHTLKGTEEISTFDFKIVGNKRTMPVRFYDFPGGYIERSANESDYTDVLKIVKQSAAIIVAVDTPYLMEPEDERGKYIRQACIRDVELVIKSAVAESEKQDRLILLVPIKCEKYTKDYASLQALKQAVKYVFSDTINMGKETYKGKLAIAIVPIDTIGNVKFSRFKTEGERVTDQVFMKLRGQKFNPRYTDQPLRFAMSFLFEQFKKQQERSKSIWDKFLDWVCVWDWEFFSPNNMPKIENFVRQGIKLTDGRFEIICGRELMGV